ncbi:MAG: Pseudouridine synthase [Caldanaerobacter subterraneus]|jgi:pseudouridine synthase|uniref:Pseudouridine synthase n=3 Tax=Caldanaerobacter subterraneus TaxID=911092 RepID=Q8R5S6_CALS4|nr:MULTISPECIES: pseudouridine synthase [Caldanaerobacter]AAM24554.1 16S rRNA uridine-516 pseudouridylate synthase and related Pseudouridylate synthase [Caldanaerobacter subterraneus subsp. tengcongensis MB4]KKC29725.1 16S rRNA uridine-516 pseudouridylate synthase family protein [Caldanaerobacter subterraneus subsp. pacificus DSM 12653]KUK09685.1 MAG: Pseudouridine synthase [Caldanaerobacter subterraneus]MBE3579539.1 rRNA pseudouridine synthase [Caldanaerobacter subterraneus]MCS3915883.1 pseud
MVRLQKYLAECGIASRRKCEEYILQGRVKVNGKVVKELGTKIDPDVDIIEFDDKIVRREEKKVYIMLYKPAGYITSVKDPFGRPTVLDLVKVKERIYPVGRLDFDTSGLLLLTNDGELANILMHPKHEIVKTYVAKIKGIPTKEEMERFENGLIIDGRKTAKAKIRILNVKNGTSVVEIQIHEGRNRQVKKMCKAIGHPVIALKRTKIGELELKGLKPGEWRYLTEDEIRYLKSLR